MKYIFLPFLLVLFSLSFARAQGKEVTGVLIDSMKVTQPGSSVRLKSDLGDSTATTTNMDGKFDFNNIRGTKITLYITSLGFQPQIKHYTLTADAKIVLPPIVLKTEKNELKEVTIVGVNPVKFAEDTVDYKVAAYKVRDNAPVEDVLKKVPGLDVDANGNVTAQGQQVTKVRINGKDFMGGDVQAATKNLPADILESIQVIDDYGDQANLTGVKTGTPNKILNFTIRADKNYGYSLTATAGGGEDMLPSAPGVSEDARYLGLVNGFDFKGDRQVTLLGNLNNTNVNTFNFTGNTGGGGGGGGGFGGGGGGGGRGNAARGGGNNTGLATVQNGITNARSIGTNYRDNWSKTVSVYGSYSFSDNTTYTASNTLQSNNVAAATTSSDLSKEHDNPINHRFTFNIEWKPDTLNYLKVTPTYSYAGTNTTDYEVVSASSLSKGVYSAYNSNSVANSQTPTVGLTALYNHRFHNRNNFSLNVTASSSHGNSYDNPIYNYTQGVPTAPQYQVINTTNTTTSVGANLSYLQHLGKVDYLEFNYAYNYSYTANDKETDTLSAAKTFNNYAFLSNNFKYTFVTNRFGLNYRVVEKKYNYTIGVGVQPAVLDGQSLTTGALTHVDQFQIVPNARYVYNFSRSQTFSINYNGNSAQPTFSQLQPVVDFSNALYPVEGNPKLQPSFSNSLQIRYNNFGIASGNIFFLNGQFSQTDNQVVANTTTYGRFSKAVLIAHPELTQYQNTNLTQYLNTNGYYSASGQAVFSKPWDERRYTLTFTGGVSYVNNIGYSSSVDSNNTQSALVRNIAHTLTLTPGARFRVDITDVIDAQALVNYSIAKTDNSVVSPFYNNNTDIRTLTLGLTGKQYILKDWTFSYDYTKLLNYGYAASEKVTDPNVLNLYLERRFLKQNRGTIRFSVYDAFNQNSGFSTTTNGSIVTQTNVNRLGRYYLATFTLRLQKFAGKAPTQNQDRRGPGQGGPGGGGGRGGFGGGGGMGGPPQ